MSEDLQSLLERINREGVEKAKAEAERIVSEAKTKAAAIVKTAGEEAAKAKADAEKASADYAARAEETIRQAARDTILKVESSVTALLEKALAKDVDNRGQKHSRRDGRHTWHRLCGQDRGWTRRARLYGRSNLRRTLKASPPRPRKADEVIKNVNRLHSLQPACAAVRRTRAD